MRLNVKLVVGLLIGAVVLVGGAFALRQWQVSRNTSNALAAAEVDMASGELDDARVNYERYLGYFPDDAEVRAKHALLVADLNEDTISRRKRQQTYQLLEQAMRLNPQSDEVRRRLVDYTISMGRFEDAVDHVNQLLASGERDTELEAKLAQCYQFMGENEKAAEIFQKAIEHDPTEVELYILLARLYQTRLEAPAEADKWIEAMVEVNPDSSQAYLARAAHREGRGDFEGAERDIEKSLELAPDNLDTLLIASSISRRRGDKEKANEYLQKALAADPKDPRVYTQMAMAAAAEGGIKNARVHIENGLKELPEDPQLLFMMANVHLEDQEVEAAQELIEQLEALEYREEDLSLLRARVHVIQGNWVQATQLLERISPLLAGRRDMRVQANMLLGFAYQQLGQNDLRLAAYRRVLADDPNNRVARAQVQGSRIEPERIEQAITQVEGQPQNAAGLASLFQLELARLTQMPEDQRDWSRAEQVYRQFVEQVNELPESEEKVKYQAAADLFHAELAAQRGNLQEALGIVRQQREENPDNTGLWLAEAALLKRAGDMEGVYQTLDQAEQEQGPQLLIGQVRIATLAAEGDEAAADKLLALEGGIKNYPEEEQAALYSVLAESLLRLGRYEDGNRLYAEVDNLTKSPDLRVRMRRFDIALANGDEQGMRNAIDGIAEVIGKESAEWNYAEAARIVKLVGLEKLPATELQKARNLVLAGREWRPDWHALTRTEAEIALLEGSNQEAIEKYELAIVQGETVKLHFLRLLQLYYAENELDKASRILERLQADDPSSLATIDRALSTRSGNLEEALEASQRIVDTTDSAVDWGIHAQLLENIERTEEAEQAYRKAAEKDPTQVRFWTTLIAFLIRQDRAAEAEEVLAQARTQLSGNDAILAEAAANDLLGNREAAEEAYIKLAAEGTPGNESQRNLVDFYLRTEQQDKATAELDKILQNVKPSDDQATDILAWARRNKAQVLGSSGNYQDFQAALALLDENATDGQLSDQDKFQKASLLSTRPDSDSRRQAMDILQEMQSGRQPSVQERVLMAQLLERDPDPQAWIRAQSIMLDLLATNGQNELFLAAYSRMLLARNQLNDAVGLVDTLGRVAGQDSDNYRDVRIRLLAKQGQKDQAVQLAETWVNETPDGQKLERIRSTAALLENLDMPEAAEKMFRQLTELDPSQLPELALYQARQKDLAAALESLQQSLNSGTQPLVVARAATAMLRVNSATATPEQEQMVESWVKTGIEESNNSIVSLLTYADLLDVLGRYSEAAEIYQQVLDRQDIQAAERLMALNNLAYVNAVYLQNPSGALPLIEEAIRLVGPVAELLDTRAMVLLANNEPAKAIEDLQRALTDSPDDALKYFHLAQAQLKANDREAAKQSLITAQDKGLNEEQLSAVERQTLDDLQKSLN